MFPLRRRQADIAGVVDTGDKVANMAPMAMGTQGPGGSCFMKKTLTWKSRARLPLGKREKLTCSPYRKAEAADSHSHS
jgi:hypothetical protein